MHPVGSVRSQPGEEGSDAPVATPEGSGTPDEPGPGRRRTEDRRREPTPMFSWFVLRGRRRGGRRLGERDHVYVDRHGWWMYAAFLALTTLSVFDARFTLHELEFGGTEANPVMRAALELGDSAFVFLKTAATIVGAAFLVLHKTWRLGRLCLFVALASYVGLTIWHIYGVAHVIPQTTGASG